MLHTGRDVAYSTVSAAKDVNSSLGRRQSKKALAMGRVVFVFGHGFACAGEADRLALVLSDSVNKKLLAHSYQLLAIQIVLLG
jgi:hypothetical protein